ncbi:hypothetical protein I3843_03G155100 [Carya illinoinensis]|nr:hypothetical protein I3843_03G155100 [Carya illinoinensis]
MNRRVRASTKSSFSPSRSEPFHKYLKPGMLAQIRDSRISARTHRVSLLYSISSSSQISIHRSTPPSTPAFEQRQSTTPGQRGRRHPLLCQQDLRSALPAEEEARGSQVRLVPEPQPSPGHARSGRRRVQ